MSLTPAWVDQVRMVQNGDPVDANYTNKAPADLSARTEYLKARIEALAQGTALRIRQTSVDSAVKGGSAVYYDGNGPKFAPALASVDFGTGTTGNIAATSYVIGVVEKKYTATVADVVTAGCVAYDDVSMVEDPSVSGPRYLSTQTPGALVAYKPPFAIYVGFWMAEIQVLVVAPEMKDSIDGHTHYRFKLYSSPAGVANDPAYMDRVEIITPNPALPGWLPADHEVFGGSAPEGAKFGYNLSKHPELFAAFPPVPIESAYIDVYLDGQGAGREFERVGVITNSGLWWMRDDWGWGPWEIDTASVPEVPPVVIPTLPPPTTLLHGHGYTGAGLQCPMTMYLWFSKPTYFNENTVVTSLVAKDGSPVSIVGCDGKEASTGALVIDVDMGLTDDGTDYPGYRVVKSIEGGQVKRGLVVEGVRSGSSVIRVSSFDGLLPDADGFYPGRVVLEYNDPSQAAREFDVQLYALDKAEQTVEQDTYFISFPAGMTSSIRGRVDIPTVGLPTGTLKMTVVFRFVVTQAGALPSLSMSYRRVPGMAYQTPGVLPGASAEVTLAAVNLALANGGSAPSVANTYFDMASASMDVIAGDSVFFTVRRNVDSYPGKVGIIRARGAIG